VLAYAAQEGLAVQGLIKSPLLGPKGNAEFLVWLGNRGSLVDISMLVDQVLQNQS
jgi:predicted rRNA methylase YqxC with S4 and FtsJ domains